MFVKNAVSSLCMWYPIQHTSFVILLLISVSLNAVSIFQKQPIHETQLTNSISCFRKSCLKSIPYACTKHMIARFSLSYLQWRLWRPTCPWIPCTPTIKLCSLSWAQFAQSSSSHSHWVTFSSGCRSDHSAVCRMRLSFQVHKLLGSKWLIRHHIAS